MYSTVKYTDDSRDSRMEWKIRIQHDPYSLDLAPFDFAFFPQLKSDLHGKRLSDRYELRTESDLKRTWFGDIYGKWVQRRRKCVKHQGEYFEKL